MLANEGLSGTTALDSPSRRPHAKTHSESGVPGDVVQSHVVGWLEMHYEPEGLDEDQMEEFEQLIELWIAPYDDIE